MRWNHIIQTSYFQRKSVRNTYNRRLTNQENLLDE